MYERLVKRGLGWSALVAALLVYPFVDRVLGFQTVHAVSDGMIYVLLALGLNIVVGYAGLLDLGYAAFFAIGAYAMGLLNSPVLGSPFYGHPWSFWLCIWIAAAVSALLGVAIGAPTAGIVGVKEAVPEAPRVRELIDSCGRDFVVLSGDDATARASIAAGARGVISVTANVAPRP